MTRQSLSRLFSGKHRPGLLLLSCLMAFTVILAACGGTTSQNTGNTTQNSILTIVPSPEGDFTRNFSPYAPSPAYGTTGLIYETLLFFNRMDGTVHPWLASSYQFSNNAKTITFTLQPNVKWSDGKPFTSADVVFTINMILQYPAADGNDLRQYISNVSAPDDHTVVVNLKTAYTPILWGLGGQTWIVPQHIFSSVGDPTKFANPNPVGTGPFTLKSFTPQLIDLVKNPNYWQPGKPTVSEVRYPAFNSNTSAELLLSQGSVDWTGLFTPNIQQTFVNRDPAHNHYWFPPSNVVMLYLNDAKAPFNNAAFRQAISDVLDRNQMYQVAESGYEPVASPTALVLPANKSYLDPNYANLSFSAPNKQQALQTLQSIGYTLNSSGVLVDKTGKPLPNFNINVVTGWTDWVSDCQIMAQDLKTIGINATVNAISFNAYFSALQLGNYDMAISWTNPGPTPYYLYNSLLNSANTAPIGSTATSNFERWNDPATDKLLNTYATSTDQNTQLQAIEGIEKIMVTQMPAIPLVYGATWNEYTTTRFTGWPTADNAYAMPAPFDYPDDEMVILNLKPVA